jgi:hypothetical protein
MLLNPSIMALILVSAVVSFMLILSTAFSLKIVRHWDILSGSELQLQLERGTYLISTLLIFAFVAELVSLLLFIYNAEAMSSQFVGAMCATGVLNINAWGWPTLFLKMAVFFSGATWLTLNYLDHQGYDYPLIKLKYALLLFITPLVILEAVAQLRYFLALDPDVITSCCGALFTPDSTGVAAEVSGLEPRTALFALYGSGAITIISGGWYRYKRNGGLLFAASSIMAFIVAITAIVSYVALYIYEHPHHHCPFCLLKSGHDFAGYFLYIPLFIATALAMATGIESLFNKIPSLQVAIERDASKLSGLAVVSFLIFYALTTFYVLNSNLVMDGLW